MTAYYNEYDPYPAQWLRNLSAAGHLPAGPVDERSIVDVRPDDLHGVHQAHFFAGIGGWPLALRLAGWPGDRPAWTGSCPCQPFSVAGKGKGEADERHLWPEFRRLIAECRPPVVFGEQVASAAGRAWLASVRADLEGLGYAVGAADLCGASVGAPHIRQRLFWVAYSLSAGRPEWRTSTRSGSTSRRGESEWMAYLHGEGRGERSERDCGQEQPGRRSSCGDDVGGRGEDGGMGNADERKSRGDTGSGARSEAQSCSGRRVDGDQCDTPRAPGADGGMGDPLYARLPLGSVAEERRRDLPGKGLAAAAASPEGWMANGEGGGCGQGRAGSTGEFWPLESDRHSADCHPWRHVVYLPCSDGKLRPTQPGLFPLAHGVPSRVGKLRAYGNAIIPQVAALFVRAFMMGSTSC